MFNFFISVYSLMIVLHKIHSRFTPEITFRIIKILYLFLLISFSLQIIFIRFSVCYFDLIMILLFLMNFMLDWAFLMCKLDLVVMWCIISLRNRGWRLSNCRNHFSFLPLIEFILIHLINIVIKNKLVFVIQLLHRQ